MQEVPIARAKLFRNNKSQAVRLPKSMELPEGVTEVEITKVGDTRVISPVGRAWDYFFDSPRASPDFMLDRDQPPDQEREGL